MPNIYQLIVQYDGGPFYGWQEQRGTHHVPSIQATFRQALRNLFGTKIAFSFQGCSRTDAGVHAFCQVVRLSLSKELPLKAILLGINAHLPHKIRVVDVRHLEKDFHPIREAKWKEYRYYCMTKGGKNAFQFGHMAKAPRVFDEKVVKEGVKLFIGTHNFRNFHCTGTPVRSTVRDIFEANFFSSSEHPSYFPSFLAPLPPELDSFEGPHGVYLFRFVGSGFLKQMVRLMVGSLWALAQGKISLEELKMSIEGTSTGKVGVVVPPQGLYLYNVSYASYPTYQRWAKGPLQ